jgi:hypothetical protein
LSSKRGGSDADTESEEEDVATISGRDKSIRIEDYGIELGEVKDYADVLSHSQS